MSDMENEMNIQDDNDSEDDVFEEDLQKQYANFPKRSDKRPESKHGRPESSKYQLERRNDQQESHESLNNIHAIQQNNTSQQYESIPISAALQKFNKYIGFHNVQIEEFWKSNKIFALPQEFAQFIQEIGYNANEDEIEGMLGDLINEYGQVTIESVCKKVPSWHNNENTMFEFIREKALKLAQESKRKFSAQTKKPKPQSASAARPYSSKAGGDFRPISGITVKSQKSKYSALTEFKIGVERPVQNQSKHYLQKAKDKDKEMDRLLQLTINKGKNEFEYEMLIKMGEANELSQMLQLKTTYRAYKSAQGNLKVHMYELDKFVKDMTLEEFQREYNMIKNKYNETRNLKIWEVLSENKKNQKSLQHFGKGAATTKDEVQNDGEVQQKVINKKERQAELKKVLLETMMLTNVLKEQLSILNRKGINPTQHQTTAAIKTQQQY